MVLVTGVTGSGKSSTMAALINYINQREARHILTLENPIEFLHTDQKSSVTQREIGSDTTDFKMGLRAALRQDPDVIMIGEMRDAETVDTAIKAAETGHLLMSTLHTPDAQSTILRIMAMFPPEEQDVIRVRLAESLYAVVSQRLLPKRSGKGRAVAAEIMINTPAIKDLILEGTRISEIRDFIADGREQYGMQTFDQCLTDLVQKGEVTFEVAKAASSNPSDFELKMRMFSQMSRRRRIRALRGRRPPPFRRRRGSALPSRRRRCRYARGHAVGRRHGLSLPMSAMSAGELRGVFAPVVTTFAPSTGDLDLAAFTSNMAAHLAAGMQGIVVTGSTGEAALLDAAERAALVEAARATVPADKLLIVGTGAESTRALPRNRRRDAAARGADAVLVVAPHYYGAAMTAEALARALPRRDRR